MIEDIDLEVGNRGREWADDIDTVRAETLWERSLRRGDWTVRTSTRTFLYFTRSHFCMFASFDAWEGAKRVYSQNWDEHIERDLV